MLWGPSRCGSGYCKRLKGNRKGIEKADRDKKNSIALEHRAADELLKPIRCALG
jgi:hypothetical protein